MFADDIVLIIKFVNHFSIEFNVLFEIQIKCLTKMISPSDCISLQEKTVVSTQPYLLRQWSNPFACNYRLVHNILEVHLLRLRYPIC